MKLNTARVMLTGASGGLGAALALQLVQQGAQVLLAGRDADKLKFLQARLGTATNAVVADVNDAQGIAELNATARGFKVNVLINNAGVGAFGLLQQQDWSAMDQVIHTNLVAPMRLTHALLPHLVVQSQAAVVNVGSMFGSLPFAGFAAYSTAKAGLRGFSQSLRRELADTQVQVVHIAPRAINTALNSPAVNALNWALGNTGDSPEFVASSILKALANNRPELHIGFPEKLFAWLNGAFPGVIDRGLASKLAVIKQHADSSHSTQLRTDL
jgi:short-subunit dehydrogenase